MRIAEHVGNHIASGRAAQIRVQVESLAAAVRGVGPLPECFVYGEESSSDYRWWPLEGQASMAVWRLHYFSAATGLRVHIDRAHDVEEQTPALPRILSRLSCSHPVSSHHASSPALASVRYCQRNSSPFSSTLSSGSHSSSRKRPSANAVACPGYKAAVAWIGQDHTGDRWSTLNENVMDRG